MSVFSPNRIGKKITNNYFICDESLDAIYVDYIAIETVKTMVLRNKRSIS